MKIYRLNEYEWWMGESLEACIQAAMKDSGLPRDEAVDEEDYCREVSDTALDRMQIKDQLGCTMSLREEMEKLLNDPEQTFPCLIAAIE